MQFVLNIIFSTIEFSAIFVLMLAMFRYSLREYLARVIFACVILSLISYLFYNVLHIQSIAPVIQCILLILLLWLMFHIHLFYAGIMGALGYISFIFYQTVLLVIVDWLGISTLHETMNNQAYSYFMQAFSAAIIFILCFFLYRYRIGFSFVPDDERAIVKLRGLNVRLLISAFFAVVLLTMLYLFALDGLNTLLFLLILMLVIVIFMLFLAIKKEIER